MAEGKGKELAEEVMENEGRKGEEFLAGEEDIQGVWVEALPTCPHVDSVQPITGREMPRFDATCQQCGDGSENWLCFCCLNVLCGRYVNKHMMLHSEENQHPLVFGFRDLSVWCFLCGSYIDGRANQKLWPYFRHYHNMKFGEEPTPYSFTLLTS